MTLILGASSQSYPLYILIEPIVFQIIKIFILLYCYQTSSTQTLTIRILTFYKNDLNISANPFGQKELKHHVIFPCSSIVTNGITRFRVFMNTMAH